MVFVSWGYSSQYIYNGLIGVLFSAPPVFWPFLVFLLIVHLAPSLRVLEPHCPPWSLVHPVLHILFCKERPQSSSHLYEPRWVRREGQDVLPLGSRQLGRLQQAVPSKIITKEINLQGSSMFGSCLVLLKRPNGSSRWPRWGCWWFMFPGSCPNSHSWWADSLRPGSLERLLKLCEKFLFSHEQLRDVLSRLSETGRRWSGEDLKASRSLSNPLVASYSEGSRCRTTDLAAPWRRCQTLDAACLRSLSLRLSVYHLHAVANASNEAGSPFQAGTPPVSSFMKSTEYSLKGSGSSRSKWPCRARRRSAAGCRARGAAKASPPAAARRACIEEAQQPPPARRARGAERDVSSHRTARHRRARQERWRSSGWSQRLPHQGLRYHATDHTQQVRTSLPTGNWGFRTTYGPSCRQPTKLFWLDPPLQLHGHVCHAHMW